MGTKSNPGRFDCYAKAEPDEPMFILLARDPQAPALVRRWAQERMGHMADYAAAMTTEEARKEHDKIKDALTCMADMIKWRAGNR